MRAFLVDPNDSIEVIRAALDDKFALAGYSSRIHKSVDVSEFALDCADGLVGFIPVGDVCAECNCLPSEFFDLGY